MQGELDVSIVARETERAYERIKGYVRKTPLEFSAYLSEKTGAEVYLKLESEQLSGAFKVRGAFNKVLKVSSENPTSQKKFFTASSGNHGLGMTMAMKATGQKGVIYVNKSVAKSKEDNLLLHKAELRKFGDECMGAEREAERAAKEEDAIYVSPYNDLDIIAGQGTIAVEIFREQKTVDAIFVAVGGGGMMSGVACYTKHISPRTEVIGCSALNSNAMEQSVKAGKVFDIVDKDTISDGSAGNIDHDTITFPLCQKNVDRWVSVTEEEISDAIYLMLDIHHKVVEGAAGVALASFLKVKDDFKGRKVAIVICGSNIGIQTLKRILDSH